MEFPVQACSRRTSADAASAGISAHSSNAGATSGAQPEASPGAVKWAKSQSASGQPLKQGGSTGAHWRGLNGTHPLDAAAAEVAAGMRVGHPGDLAPAAELPEAGQHIASASRRVAHALAALSEPGTSAQVPLLAQLDAARRTAAQPAAASAVAGCPAGLLQQPCTTDAPAGSMAGSNVPAVQGPVHSTAADRLPSQALTDGKVDIMSSPSPLGLPDTMELSLRHVSWDARSAQAAMPGKSSR